MRDILIITSGDGDHWWKGLSEFAKQSKRSIIEVFIGNLRKPLSSPCRIHPTNVTVMIGNYAYTDARYPEHFMPSSNTTIWVPTWMSGGGQCYCELPILSIGDLPEFCDFFYRPINERGERMTPSDLVAHRRTHRLRGPMCLCPLIQSRNPPDIVEAAISIVTSGNHAGEYIACCAEDICGYMCEHRFLNVYINQHPYLQ
jgi:hypothetical protein